MKCLGKFTILGAVLAASTTLAYASPIQLGSYASGAGSQGNANSAMTFSGVEFSIRTAFGTRRSPTPRGLAQRRQ
jgi:hypothetical protein